MIKTPLENQNNESNELLNRLKSDFATIENKNREFNSKKIVEENKLKEAKGKMIQQLFSMMQEVGVDPNNLESINAFLAQLSEQDPDLLALFEAAFNNIAGEEDTLSGENMQEIPVKNPVGIDSTRPDVAPTPHSVRPTIPTEKTFENIRQ